MDLPLSMILFPDNYYKKETKWYWAEEENSPLVRKTGLEKKSSIPNCFDFPVGSTPCHDTQKAIFQPKIGLHTPSKLYAWSQYTPYQTAGIDIPVFAQTTIDCGDTLELVGLKKEVESAAKELGYIDRPTNATDMTFVGLGILLGGIIGALAIHIAEYLLAWALVEGPW